MTNVLRKFGRREVGLVRFLFFIGLSLLPSLQHMADAASVQDWQQCLYRDVYWPTLNLSPDSASFLVLVLRLALVSSAIGFLTTLSYWISFLSLSLLILNWLPFCFATHEFTPLPVAILLWALLDRSSGYRIDQKVFKRRLQKANKDRLTQFLIPAQRLHFVLIFLSSGIAKIVNGGMAWVQDPTLKDILVFQNFFFEKTWLSSIVPELNHALTGWPMFCVILSIAVVAIETLAPLALLNRWATRLIVPSLLCMQIGIGLVLYIGFWGWLVLYVFWIPERVLRFLEHQASSRK